MLGDGLTWLTQFAYPVEVTTVVLFLIHAGSTGKNLGFKAQG
jgi:hypothetical protein